MLSYDQPIANVRNSGQREPRSTGVTHFPSKLTSKLSPTVGAFVRRPKELLAPLRNKQFVYAPLPRPSCIRLLNIKAGGHTDLIQCSVHVVDLDENPLYTALSYTWEQDYALPYFLVDTLNGKTKDTTFNIWNNLTRAAPGALKGEDSVGFGESFRDKYLHAKRSIVCDGQIIPVTPNLHDALLQLRRTRPGNYWIDAICINQQDTVERSSQVQMMGRIYKSAELVTVWLGTSSALLSSGMKKLLLSPTSNLPDATAMRKSMASDDASRNIPLFVLVSASITLLTRRWFSRLWVIQELCLAREVTFFLGDYQFGSDALDSAYEWINTLMEREYWEIVFRIDAMKALNQGIHIKHLPLSLNMRKRLKYGTQLNLEEWVELCRGRQASDPRDMLYGGLAMIRPDLLYIDQSIQIQEEEEAPPLPARPDNYSPPLPPRPGSHKPTHETSLIKQRQLSSPKLWAYLHPDYTVDAQEVFFNLAACQLSQPTGINLLSMATRCWDTEFSSSVKDAKASGNSIDPFSDKLPSWVPCPGSWDSNILPTFASLGGTGFAACTSQRSWPKISADGKTLFVDATILDVIQECTITGRRDFVKSSPYGLQTPIGYLEDVLRFRREYATTGQPMITAIANTLTAGLWDGSDYASWFYGTNNEKMVGFCHHLHDLVRTEAKKLQEAESPAASVADLSSRIEQKYQALKAAYPNQPWPKDSQADSNNGAKSTMEQFRATQESAFSWRSVFTTANGYLVLGPAWAREGDTVMLVKGGRVPYVFTHSDEFLRRQIVSKQKTLREGNDGGSKAEKNSRSDLQREIYELQTQLGQNDKWILVGEAYVEGFMYGEGTKEEELYFDRIGIV